MPFPPLAEMEGEAGRNSSGQAPEPEEQRQRDLTETESFAGFPSDSPKVDLVRLLPFCMGCFGPTEAVEALPGEGGEGDAVTPDAQNPAPSGEVSGARWSDRPGPSRQDPTLQVRAWQHSGYVEDVLPALPPGAKGDLEREQHPARSTEATLPSATFAPEGVVESKPSSEKVAAVINSPESDSNEVPTESLALEASGTNQGLQEDASRPGIGSLPLRGATEVFRRLEVPQSATVGAPATGAGGGRSEAAEPTTAWSSTLVEAGGADLQVSSTPGEIGDVMKSGVHPNRRSRSALLETGSAANDSAEIPEGPVAIRGRIHTEEGLRFAPAPAESAPPAEPFDAARSSRVEPVVASQPDTKDPAGPPSRLPQPKVAAPATAPDRSPVILDAPQPAQMRTTDGTPAPSAPPPATVTEWETQQPASTANRALTVRLNEQQYGSAVLRLSSNGGGQLEVSIRTPDSQLSQMLRRSLPELTQRLERAGMSSEFWPGASGVPPGAASSQEQGSSPQDWRERHDPNLWEGASQQRQSRQDRSRWDEYLRNAAGGK